MCAVDGFMHFQALCAEPSLKRSGSSLAASLPWLGMRLQPGWRATVPVHPAGQLGEQRAKDMLKVQ